MVEITPLVLIVWLGFWRVMKCDKEKDLENDLKKMAQLFFIYLWPKAKATPLQAPSMNREAVTQRLAGKSGRRDRNQESQLGPSRRPPKPSLFEMVLSRLRFRAP